jgi:hypothetical protein
MQSRETRHRPANREFFQNFRSKQASDWKTATPVSKFESACNHLLQPRSTFLLLRRTGRLSAPSGVAKRNFRYLRASEQVTPRVKSPNAFEAAKLAGRAFDAVSCGRLVEDRYKEAWRIIFARLTTPHEKRIVYRSPIAARHHLPRGR